MKDLAKGDIQRIVLAEGEEERNLTAASTIHSEKIAEVILLGNEEVIKEKAIKLGVSGR
jgi:phosphate acetyltransferase